MTHARPTMTEGHWTWHSGQGRLLIEAATDGPLSDISGDWSLDAFGKMLEGLSKGRLAAALDGTGGTVRCELRLSNGRSLHLVGAFVEDGEAKGILLSDAADASPRAVGDGPGPQLEPVFQPIISLRDGEVAGFEALARWTGEHGPIAEARFEDEALATNMLIRSAETLSMLREVSGRDDMFMHVNITARDLVRDATPALVEALLNGHKLPPRALRIELTEQAALRDSDVTLEVARRLKAIGAGLVLDDFGSGHSSFLWLSDLPADSLKVDPSLTQRLDHPRVKTILSTITLLAERLNMTSTAEGVEREADLPRLRALGFDHAQGYAFARPMNGADAAVFLTQ